MKLFRRAGGVSGFVRVVPVGRGEIFQLHARHAGHFAGRALQDN